MQASIRFMAPLMLVFTHSKGLYSAMGTILVAAAWTVGFGCASGVQSMVHADLAARRAVDGGRGGRRYVAMAGGVWEVYVAPHYTAEVVVYAALGCVDGGRDALVWAAVAFVWVNLWDRAVAVRKWGTAVFGPGWERGRRTLV